MAQIQRVVLDRPQGQGDRAFDERATYLRNNPLFNYDATNVRKLNPGYVEMINAGLGRGASKEERNQAIAALNYVRKHGDVSGWTPKERKVATQAQILESNAKKELRRTRAIAQRQAWGRTEREVMAKVATLNAGVPTKEGAENMEYRAYSRSEGPRVRNSLYYVSNGVLRGGTHVAFTTTNETVTFPLAVRSRRMLNSLATYEDPKLAIPKRKVLFRVGRWGKGRPVEQEEAAPVEDVNLE